MKNTLPIKPYCRTLILLPAEKSVSWPLTTGILIGFPIVPPFGVVRFYTSAKGHKPFGARKTVGACAPIRNAVHDRADG